MSAAGPLAGLAPRLRAPGGALRESFRRAKPYRHIVLDGFLSPALARAAAREAARAGTQGAREDYSGDRTSIRRDFASLGPALARVDALTRSPEFLGWLARLAGLPDLRRNLEGSCGGLFRYEHAAEMDVHIDSNDVDIHCAQVGHRRKLNLLLYLTPAWRPQWGGEFELFCDPRRPARRRVAPLFNRCVLFESHDASWHAVGRVDLPPERRELARAALILNFYSTCAKGAPKTVPHYNILVPRPLPAGVRAGAVPSVGDLIELAGLLLKREGRIGKLRRLDALSRTLREPPPPRPGSGTPAHPAAALLALLPPGLAPGRPFTRADVARLRALFARKDAELMRLYRREYANVQRLKARAPALMPGGY